MQTVIRRLTVTTATFALMVSAAIAQKRTAWDGVYTEAQAKRGADTYSTTCAGCHRPDLSGDGTVPALAGQEFMFQWTDTTLDQLFKRIKTAMPPDKPDSLAPEEYRDIIAFLLQSNKFPAGQTELTPDPDSLQQISITASR
jgi:mono/diheme cytochrome c family protein